MGSSMADDAGWVVVVPVKSLGRAKSRLDDVAGRYRPGLALAMVADTIAAAGSAVGVRVVLVVTNDREVEAAASACGAMVLPDQPEAGLNQALEHGIAMAIVRYPGRGVALMAGDLPALRPTQLDAVLRLAPHDRAATDGQATPVVVADRHGEGTTLLAARTPTSLRPSFGAGSFARHREVGAVAVDLPGLDGLRCDVDDAADLQQAVLLGVGPATAKTLHDFGFGGDPR